MGSTINACVFATIEYWSSHITTTTTKIIALLVKSKKDHLCGVINILFFTCQFNIDDVIKQHSDLIKQWYIPRIFTLTSIF